MLADLGIVFAAFLAVTAVAYAAGAANLGTAAGIGQLAFVGALVFVLTRR